MINSRQVDKVELENMQPAPRSFASDNDSGRATHAFTQARQALTVELVENEVGDHDREVTVAIKREQVTSMPLPAIGPDGRSGHEVQADIGASPHIRYRPPKESPQLAGSCAKLQNRFVPRAASRQHFAQPPIVSHHTIHKHDVAPIAKSVGMVLRKLVEYFRMNPAIHESGNY